MELPAATGFLRTLAGCPPVRTTRLRPKVIQERHPRKYDLSLRLSFHCDRVRKAFLSDIGLILDQTLVVVLHILVYGVIAQFSSPAELRGPAPYTLRERGTGIWLQLCSPRTRLRAWHPSHLEVNCGDRTPACPLVHPVTIGGGIRAPMHPSRPHFTLSKY